jgi:hypothetical protein
VTYRLQRRLKSDEYLTPEEVDVKSALRDYVSFSDGATVSDWCPLAPLYRQYLESIADRPYDPEGPDRLNIRQFGAALLRVYPDLDALDEKGNRVYRVQQTVAAKRVWGYLGLKGPHSLIARESRGRPRHDNAPADI